jgi:hypothetical protein
LDDEQALDQVLGARRHHLIEERGDGPGHLRGVGLDQQRGERGEHGKERQQAGVGGTFGDAEAIVVVGRQHRQLEQPPEPNRGAPQGQVDPHSEAWAESSLLCGIAEGAAGGAIM